MRFVAIAYYVAIIDKCRQCVGVTCCDRAAEFDLLSAWSDERICMSERITQRVYSHWYSRTIEFSVLAKLEGR